MLKEYANLKHLSVDCFIFAKLDEKFRSCDFQHICGFFEKRKKTNSWNFWESLPEKGGNINCAPVYSCKSFCVAKGGPKCALQISASSSKPSPVRFAPFPENLHSAFFVFNLRRHFSGNFRTSGLFPCFGP